MQPHELLFNPAKLTVMVVDDHDPIRKSIKRVLVGMGFGEVIECFDGEEAIKVLAKKPVDILVCDLYMRNVSGFEVLEHIRSRDIGCDVPVVIVTGEASKEEIVKVVDMGAEDYVLKPFQASDLEKKVVRTLNKFYSPTPLLRMLRKAERHYLAQEFNDALDAFNAAIGLEPNGARAAHGKALTLNCVGRESEALHLLQETIQKNHSYYKSYGAMADIFVKQNKNVDAIEAMRRELEINPKQASRQIQLAKLLLKEGDAMGAVEHYRIALQEDPKRLGALMGMGHAYAMADNLEKAFYYFKRVRRYHPTQTKALEAALRSALAANDPKRAEVFLRDEKASFPDRYDTYGLLAQLYLRLERDDDALQVMNDLLTRDPENTIGLRMKAMLYMRKSDFTNAVNILQMAAKVAPSAEIFASLGECHIAMAKMPEAIDSLHKALSMNAEHPQAVFLLAEAHRKSQQWIKAHYLYKKAMLLGAPKDRCQAESRECTQQLQLRRRPRAAS